MRSGKSYDSDRRAGRKNLDGPKRARTNSSGAPSKRRKQVHPKTAVEGVENTSTKHESIAEVPLITARKPGQIRTPPPDAPPSVPASHPLVPREADDPVLRDDHEIHTVSISTSAVIQHKVRKVIALLEPQSSPDAATSALGRGEDDGQKRIVVALVARGAAANKCITVAEIAKREFSKLGVVLRQYTGSWSRLETFEPKERHSTESGRARDGPDEDMHDEEVQVGGSEEEGEAFETMDVAERKLVRSIPCLVIYLSSRAVPRLKDLYGEQLS